MMLICHVLCWVFRNLFFQRTDIFLSPTARRNRYTLDEDDEVEVEVDDEAAAVKAGLAKNGSS